MDLTVITLTLCLSLLVMLTPSAASQQIHVQSSYHTMPRKLRLLEEVKANAGSKENFSSDDKRVTSGSEFSGEVSNSVKSQVWSTTYEDQEQCKNGRRGRTSTRSFLQWIIPMLEDDVPYTTGPCR